MILTSVGPTAARVAPVLVLLGYLIRPYVQSYMDAASVAEIASVLDISQELVRSATFRGVQTRRAGLSVLVQEV